MTLPPEPAIALVGRLLAQSLTPLERLNAARRLGAGSTSLEQWITLALVAVLVVMVGLLIRVSYNRIQQERRQADQVFIENARRRSLSVREFHLLQEVIKLARLRNKNLIFQDPAHFERGAALLLKASAEQQPEELHRRLEAEVTFLQEKLGFHDTAAPVEPTQESRGKRRQLSTRDIPVGKPLHITRRLGQLSDELEAHIVENDPNALTVELIEPVKITFGEVWRARYFFGASVWEFDTSVISYDGNRLMLRHSTDVRFINRRRFVRVPVRNLAFVCRFPFARSLDPETGLPQGFQDGAATDWKPLEFVHAVVTELAGPGLKLEAPLEVQPGDRLLVIFRLDASVQQRKGARHRLIEDVGEVRRVDRLDSGGFAIALEMVGLKDADLDELVRMTNLSAFRQGAADTGQAEEGHPATTAETETLVHSASEEA